METSFILILAHLDLLNQASINLSQWFPMYITPDMLQTQRGPLSVPSVQFFSGIDWLQRLKETMAYLYTKVKEVPYLYDLS